MSALAPGARLGPYEIVAPLGAGGMGEVYRASDARLHREVAIKILPEAVAREPDRRARFEREAQTIAALSHPNILAVFDTGLSGGQLFVVTELLRGETLRDRLLEGALPVRKAIDIVAQIARGLAAAHELGLVHRDLKPENIFLTTDGHVKILDFGLARSATPTTGSTPTVTVVTDPGTVMGTVGYMAPEQVRAEPIDARADLFALGAVLYEILSGRRAFHRDTAAETMTAILKEDPREISACRGDLSPALDRIVRHALEKRRTERFQTARDIAFALEALSGSDPALTPASARPRPSRAARRWLTVALMGGAVLGAAALLRWAPWQTPAPATPLTVSADVGANASLFTNVGAAAVLSPDGKLLAFTAQTDVNSTSALYVRRLDQLTASRYDGTEGAQSPFFSPDGQWIAFFTKDKLKKVSAQGGATVTLHDVVNGRGGDWAEDDTIIFTPSTWTSLFRMPAGGGQAAPIGEDARDGEATRRWPQVLPGGKAVIYTSHKAVLGFDDATIVAQTLPAGERKVLVRGGYYARYVRSGHLIYMARNALVAVPFNPVRLEVTGPAVTVLEGVINNAERTAGAQFAASANGTLVYLPGESIRNDVPIGWIDPSGKTTNVDTPRGIWGSLRLAPPDGRRLAIDIREGGDSRVWVYDFARDVPSQVTSSWALHPVWTPDGRRIAFATLRGRERQSPSGTFTQRGEETNLAWQRADGSGEAERLTDSSHRQAPGSWHPNGRLLAFEQETSPNKFDLMMLPIEGTEASGWKAGKPTVFLSGSASLTDPQFSPDGRWIAYVSTETGRPEVWVTAATGTGLKSQISRAGGVSPVWSRATQELLYATETYQLMVAGYSDAGGVFQSEKPHRWSDVQIGAGIGVILPRRFDVQPDGKRIIAALASQQQARLGGNRVVFVFNFFDELRRVAPVRK
jgi:serine/threonine protein kinase/Tol biopolymer transport system component